MDPNNDLCYKSFYFDLVIHPSPQSNKNITLFGVNWEAWEPIKGWVEVETQRSEKERR